MKTKGHTKHYYCATCGVLMGQGLCRCGGYHECEYEGPEDLCEDCRTETEVEVGCTYTHPCAACVEQAMRLGRWPDPMGDQQITFCERDRISADGP
jgi:hypothetical protein